MHMSRNIIIRIVTILTSKLFTTAFTAKTAGRLHWEDGLLFLRDFNWDAPPYRATMITKINHRLETNVVETFHRVTHASTEACRPTKHHKHNDRQDFDFDTDPILALQVLCERLVLFPLPPLPATAPARKSAKKNGSQLRHASVNRTIHE